MRVLISGASGMIGTAVASLLQARGDEVGALVRPGRAPGPRDVAWDPDAGTIDEAALAALAPDAVLHFAGESLLGRWTPLKRARIHDSRVNGTRLLAGALARMEQRPSSLLVASATGYYGDAGEAVLTEQAPNGEGFLAGVVAAWEAAADDARAAGIRTAHLRMSPVYSPQGGALKAQLTPFRLGVGGRVGAGRQWSAWVGLHEAAAIWAFVLDTPAASGPINVVGPTPVRNAELARTLGRVLHRPAIMPAPVPLMRLALGRQLIDEMLLASQKAVPARLEGLGYDFTDRTIEAALRRELGRQR